MWGESNAVVFSNSVLGSRTEKYADYFDICAAIVGFVPHAGVHRSANRKPSIVIDATSFIREHLLAQYHTDTGDENNVYKSEIDSFFPIMGWLSGKLSDGRIPLILGFDLLPSVSRDNLKAFSAAFGTTASSPMFHMANITPEAIGNTLINGMIQSCGERRIEVSKEDVMKAYITLDSGKESGDEISLVALGNPHLSIEELKDLINIISLDDRPKHDNVKLIATLGRHIHSTGNQLGYTKKLEAFGVTFINDTCWCMLLHPPIIPSANPSAKILTNSGKYAHYGPGLTNCHVRFGSMYQCIEAAKSGRMGPMEGRSMSWLRPFSTETLIRHITSMMRR
jgi:predicted aconitase